MEARGRGRANEAAPQRARRLARPRCFARACAAILGIAWVGLGAGEARSAVHSLTTPSIEVVLDQGVPVEVRNRLTGQRLISQGEAPDTVALFGPATLPLAGAVVQERATARDVITRHEFPDGSAWTTHWSTDPSGDLVIRSGGRCRVPAGQFRFPLRGCNIRDLQLVTVSNFGVGVTHRAPWEEPPPDPSRPPDEYFPQYVQPLVALFEGAGGGFFVEGRYPEVGPANLITHGAGEQADLIFIRGLPHPTRTPSMFELRIRAYEGRWQRSVDPHVNWMEHGLGMVPLERREPAWVRDIRAQTYVDPREWVEGEGLAKLERIAKLLDPAETLLGKVSEYRPVPEFGFDMGYPNYTPTDESLRFIRRARELGFHVAIHFNTTGIDTRFADLIARFRLGLQQTGTDDRGNPVYWGPRFTNAYGQVSFAYCSTAYKPWRDYLIAQMKDIVDAGADVIYLDESHTPTGALTVDRADAIAGVMALEREILQAYPHVAIQTEQFNPMNARHASFALTSMQLGHPLSAYLFGRFVKVCCWYGMYQLTEDSGLDGWERWGCLVPGAESAPAWIEVAQAFQRFDLEPSPGCELGPGQLSGFVGPDGIRAFFEKRDGRRGLVVRRPDGTEEWFGQREMAVP